MKKSLFTLFAVTAGFTLVAQQSGYMDDAQLSRWVIDGDLLGGLSNQKYTVPNSAGNYLNSVNAAPGNLGFTKGLAAGADGQVGFFFGKRRHIGVGTGLLFLRQQGDAMLSNYHMEFQATDFNGSPYREVVTGSNIKENLTITNINIPLLLKYKNRLSKRWGVAADAGLLYNLQMQNAYTTHADFDYEAVYHFGVSGDGTKVPLYDNAVVPSSGDWMITKAEFLRNNPSGNMTDYFDAKSALGYNVGLNRTPTNTNGTVDYPQGNIGLLVRPSVNYFLSDHVALNFGLYYMYQPFKTHTSTAYHLTDAVGGYSSVLNSTSAVDNMSYGINIGAKIFFGKKQATPLVITSVDKVSPTACGMTDGSIAINGLKPDKSVTIDYKLDGIQQNQFAATVARDGRVTMDKLAAGEYSGIKAMVGHELVTTPTVNLYDPPMASPSQIVANPTAAGNCNGFVILKGMPANTVATISYMLNGVAQMPFTGKVDSDRLITLNGLCAGKYTSVMAVGKKCSAPCPDFTLAPPESPIADDLSKMQVVNKLTGDGNASSFGIESVDIATPMLFDVNEYVLHPEAYPIINQAFRALQQNKRAYLIVQGNADSTGEEAKNVPLSLNRAKAVKHELTKRGIKPWRITTIGHGSKDPVATNKTYIGKEENRNAVMTIFNGKTEPMITEDKK